MNIKTSAHYQREYRRRLREQGLVKKEIWIRPEQAEQVRAFEKAMRGDGPEASDAAVARLPWSMGALYGELLGTPLVRTRHATVELIESGMPAILVVMHDFGDLPVFVSVAGDQLVVEAILWRLVDVENPAAFDASVLRTHKYFPLSTLCLEPRADEDYYLMFGALRADTSLDDIVQLIGVLANNVIDATEAYVGFLILADESSGGGGGHDAPDSINTNPTTGETA